MKWIAEADEGRILELHVEHVNLVPSEILAQAVAKVEAFHCPMGWMTQNQLERIIRIVTEKESTTLKKIYLTRFDNFDLKRWREMNLDQISKDFGVIVPVDKFF